MCHHRRRCHGGCNAPQPYGAYYPPAPYGAYNAPQPYGAYDVQQPYGLYNRRGCHGRRHGGPISALFALAVPLLTGNSQQQQQQEQPQMQQQQQQRSVSRDFNSERLQNADYYQNSSSSTTTNLAPQDFGYTTTREVQPRAPASKAPATAAAGPGAAQEYSSTPRDAPPAYEDSPSREVPTLEKSLEGMTLSSSTSAPRVAPAQAPAPAPAYTPPTGASYAPQQEGQRQEGYMPQQPQQQQPQQQGLDPNSWWASKMQRKEEKVRAKLERKAKKYARKERGY